jgi:hypothetical protein
MIDYANKDYNRLLENLASELDIPPAKYREAIERYQSIAKVLMSGAYPHATEETEVYVQGSFRLGTVVRPLRNGQESDYDLDLVCEIPIPKSDTNPKTLKRMVGDQLKSNGTYSKMLKPEGRRCFTIEYASPDGIGFHIDILPAVPENAPVRGIAITHREKNSGEYAWRSSNPKGYSDWFDSIKSPTFAQIAKAEKTRLYEAHRSVYESVQAVPDAMIKTPLQRAIQIMKRHRDTRFWKQPDEESKPISIIITTLSARLYGQEADILGTLRNIVEKLHLHARLLQPNSWSEGLRIDNMDPLITRKPDGTWQIPNPVNPSENFADRWHEENDAKAKAFFRWVEWIKEDLVAISNLPIEKIGHTLLPLFEERIIKKAAEGIYDFQSDQKAKPQIVIRDPVKPWGLSL